MRKKKQKTTDRVTTFMTYAGLLLIGMGVASTINLEEITSWRVVAERLVPVLKARYQVPVNLKILEDNDPSVVETSIVRDISYALAEAGDWVPVDDRLLGEITEFQVLASDTVMWVTGRTHKSTSGDWGPSYYPLYDLAIPTGMADLNESLQLDWRERLQIRPIVFSPNRYTLSYLISGLAFMALARQRRRALEREAAEAAERKRASCIERQQEAERRLAERRQHRSQRLTIAPVGAPTNGNGQNHHDPAQIRQAYSEIMSLAQATILAINRAQLPESWTRTHHGPAGVQQLTHLRSAIEQTLAELVDEYQDGSGRFRWAKARRIEDLHHDCAALIGEPIETAL